MIKLSERLLSVANFIDIDDALVDVGCDHGYLSIYLMQNKLCQKVIATDINQNALNNAIYNIKRNNLNIETILSDGLEKVNLNNINTLVITGMGTATILHILKSADLNNIKKIIIQSNNDYTLLRENMNKLGYYLIDDDEVFDKNIWYVTMKFVKSEKKNDLNIINYGYLNNSLYCNYLVEKYRDILKKIPDYLIEERNLYLDKIAYIEKNLKSKHVKKCRH